MIEQSDINTLIGVAAAAVSAVALLRSFSKDASGSIDGLRREIEAKLEGVRDKTDGNIKACILENKDARHQWANEFGGKLMELANDLRRHKDGAETKLEAEQRERRIMASVTEVKSETSSVAKMTHELRDMMTRIMAKMDILPKQGGD